MSDPGSGGGGAHLHPSPPSRTRSWLLVLVLVVACSVGWSARPVWAHTSLVSSTPASGAVVVDPVEVVTLVFNQPVSPRQVQVVVTGPDGADVTEGPVEVSGGTVSRSVGAWSASGEHLLAYRVLAEDGHPITGRVPFEVALPAAAPSPPGTTAAPPTAPSTAPSSVAGSAQPPQPGGTMLVPALVAALAGLAVVLVVGAVRAGRRAEVGG